MTLPAGRPVSAGDNRLREEQGSRRPGAALSLVQADGVLVTRLTSADEAEACDALLAIRTLFAERLVEIARYLVGSDAEARDLVDELVADLWSRRSTLAIDVNLRAYLERAIEHRALNALRAGARRRRREAAWLDETVSHGDGREPAPGGDVAVDGDADARLEAAEIRAALLQALQALPDRQRQVFRCRCVDGMKFRAIAQVLGMQEQTARNHFSRVIETLSTRFPWLRSPKG